MPELDIDLNVLRRKGNSADPLIELVDVSRVYEAGHVEALTNVSLSVIKGEFLSIVGPSGSGKTTLLNLMSGLDMPTGGAVFFEGIRTEKQDDWTRLRAHRIGFVFQSFQLLPSFTALENVQIPMFGIRQDPKERKALAHALLEKVGLASKMSRRPDELSVGEKQRVAIARSLANSPSVLLADEPTGNLDSKSASTVMDLLVDLTKTRGLTLVVVTHNPSIAQDADRAVEFLDGKIAFIAERNLP